MTSETLPEKLKDASKAAVFRHRTATAEQCSMASTWASSQEHTPYDYAGAARVGLQPDANTWALLYTGIGLLTVCYDAADGREEGHDASFFCSELIFRAFAIAGAPIVEYPHLAGPGRLLHTRELIYMGDLQRFS